MPEGDRVHEMGCSIKRHLGATTYAPIQEQSKRTQIVKQKERGGGNLKRNFETAKSFYHMISLRHLGGKRKQVLDPSRVPHLHVRVGMVENRKADKKALIVSMYVLAYRRVKLNGTTAFGFQLLLGAHGKNTGVTASTRTLQGRLDPPRTGKGELRNNGSPRPHLFGLAVTVHFLVFQAPLCGSLANVE